MNALQTPLSPVRPTRSLRVTHKGLPRSNPRALHRNHHHAIAIETSIKLTVNLVISGAAITALTQLLPYSIAQQAKLQEVRSEVKTTQGRVSHLKSEFNRYFDPRQAKSIMQEETNRADPNQRVVVLEEPAPETAAQLP
ncbi:slr1601 family putative cell division protein [Phormidesmis priestleyi]